jgi:hypothetical protein
MRTVNGKVAWVALVTLAAIACGSGVSSLGGQDRDAASGGAGTGGSGGSTSGNPDGAADVDSGTTTSPQPVVFAPFIRTNDILVDDNGVYVLSGAGEPTTDVLRLNKADGSPTVLAATQRFATNLTGDGTDLYYDGDGAIHSVPKAGGTVRTVMGAKAARALDQDHLYWTESFTGSIEAPQPVDSKLFSVPKSGGNATLLLMPPIGTGIGDFIAADDSAVYFQSGLELQALGPGATAPRKVADFAESTMAMYLDDTDIYLGVEHVEPVSATVTGFVMKVPKSGGTSTTIATLQSLPLRMALDAAYLYFTDVDGGTVVKVPKAGGPPVILASGQARPVAIAVDDTNVYWANIAADTIMKVAK